MLWFALSLVPPLAFAAGFCSGSALASSRFRDRCRNCAAILRHPKLHPDRA